ncbi:MAG: tRNA (adenosine(37)-N6)-dimethylallyltransferase MiaA [Gemmatimonadetes bacterium]|nr:tRNA (adenosine(37)-N6)-dimethylallyltransferase MiaA [Gemmatimonadota bacterium]
MISKLNPTFIALTGPTTSGKTQLSCALARILEVEIISMDSRQVYKGMDIGTDKVPDDVREQVPHHALDLVHPDERYSAGQFARDARDWIKEIIKRDRVPVLAGGTGFFLKAITEPVFSEPPLDSARLKKIRRYLSALDYRVLAKWVENLDPVRASLAIDGGPQRMSRTIEVALLTGKPLSSWHRESPSDVAALTGLIIQLELPREEIDRRINDRVTYMVERGLVSEVRSLLEAGYTFDDPGMTATGYREIAHYLEGGQTLEEAMEEIRRNTRRYARRQLTWFRNQLPPSVCMIDATASIDVQATAVLDAWIEIREQAGLQIRRVEFSL